MSLSEIREAVFWKAHKTAFLYYICRGQIPSALTKIMEATASDEALWNCKFNPNHNPDNGQFTSGDGGEDDSGNDPDAITPVYPVETALALALGGEAVTAARGALGLTEGAEAVGEDAAADAGLTAHGAERISERGITDEEAQEAINTATQSGDTSIQMGKYGTSQQVYNGSNGITVIVESSGRNAGKIIALWRNK